MTWVVGCGTIEFGVLVGDICLSYNDGNRRWEELSYGIRKIHRVYPSVWVGFAGSVELGFRLSRRLQAFARAEFETAGEPLEPDELISRFVDREGPRYSSFAEDLRFGGCRLLIVAAEQKWVEGSGKPLFRLAVGRIVKFPCPGKSGVEVSEIPLNRFGSIGSGSGIARFQQHLDDSVSDGKQGLLMFSPANNIAFKDSLPLAGFITSLGLGSVVESSPVLGISSQMFVAVVTPNGSYFGSNEGAELQLDDGSTQSVAQLPPIADTLDGWNLLRARFPPKTPAVAIC